MSSTLQFVADGLEMIWASGAKAAKVRQDFDVRLLLDSTAAIERAGYRVCYVDLPDTVSGFATVIDGKRYIVLNRAKSPEHLHFTLSHELGHHILHLDTSRIPTLGLPFQSDSEFQAHQFAIMWVLLLARDKEYEDVLRQNPDALLVGAISLLLTGCVVLMPLLAHFLFSLRTPRGRTAASQ